MDSSASKNFELTAAVLHIIAMTLMLMDHLWATLLPAKEWLTCAGRVAFPIFAFMAVEGYFHTRSFPASLCRQSGCQNKNDRRSLGRRQYPGSLGWLQPYASAQPEPFRLRISRWNHGKGNPFRT